MSRARTTTLARLRGQIDRLESGATGHALRTSLGHAEADAALRGGLIRGALHEVFSDSRNSASATGFTAAAAWRLADQRPLLWVRQDFSARENGEVAMSGFVDLGLDPRRIVIVYAADAESALRVTADALACPALGAVVAEMWGETRAFDLVASRKLTLAANQSGVAALMLRVAAQPQTSTAETRWIVRAAHSPPDMASRNWGAPVLNTHLVRNRHGENGRWVMEWNSDDGIFRETQADSQPLAAAFVHRPDQAAGRAARRAG